MVDIDARKLTDQLSRLLGACDALPQIAEQVRGETRGYLVISANANIYETQRGAYERTGDYLQGLEAYGSASRNKATITAENSVEYAGYVEGGQDGLSYAMLQQMASQRPDPTTPFTVGRSGVDWTRAGPVVTGAQAFAAFRLLQLFREKVQVAVRKT